MPDACFYCAIDKHVTATYVLVLGARTCVQEREMRRSGAWAAVRGKFRVQDDRGSSIAMSRGS